jgi:hypothetical protein
MRLKLEERTALSGFSQTIIRGDGLAYSLTKIYVSIFVFANKSSRRSSALIGG